MRKIAFLFFFAFIMSCKLKEKGSVILPPISLLLIDSTTLFNTNAMPAGDPIVLIYFSPDCHYCQEETKSLLKNIEILRDVRFCMLTPSSFDELREFYNLYKIGNYKNITIGKDYDFSFVRYFKPTSIPYMVVYNRQKKLDKIFIGNVRMEMVIDAIKKQ